MTARTIIDGKVVRAFMAVAAYITEPQELGSIMTIKALHITVLVDQLHRVVSICRLLPNNGRQVATTAVQRNVVRCSVTHITVLKLALKPKFYMTINAHIHRTDQFPGHKVEAVGYSGMAVTAVHVNLVPVHDSVVRCLQPIPWENVGHIMVTADANLKSPSSWVRDHPSVRCIDIIGSSNTPVTGHTSDTAVWLVSGNSLDNQSFDFFIVSTRPSQSGLGIMTVPTALRL